VREKNICIYTIYSMYEISIRLHNTLMIPFDSFNPNIVSPIKKLSKFFENEQSVLEADNEPLLFVMFLIYPCNGPILIEKI